MQFLDRIFGSRGGKRRHFKVTLDGTTFSCPQGRTLLDAALDAGVRMSHSCQVGACGACRCRVLEGRYHTQRAVDHLVPRDDQSRGLTLGCQTVPESDLVVVTACTVARGTLTSCRRLDEKVLELRLRPEVPIAYEIGQSIYLSPQGTDFTRALSMTRLHAADDELAFHLKRRPTGRFSCWLDQQLGKSGATIELSQPVGQVPDWSALRFERVLCIAGGSGMGVAASAARGLAVRTGAGLELVAINRESMGDYHRFVVRAATDALPGPAIVHNIRFLDWTNPMQTHAVRELVQQLRPAAASSVAVVCGSELVVEHATGHLKHAGFSESRIWSIRFMPAAQRQPKHQTGESTEVAAARTG